MKTLPILSSLLLIPGSLVLSQLSSATNTSSPASQDTDAYALTGTVRNEAPQSEQDTLRKDKDTPPPDFVQVEKEPVVKKRTNPHYPEVALKAGLEGKVWVKLWVNVDGKVQEAEVIKSDNAVFNGAAIEAARQFEFEPAMIKGKPVAVWVSVPFAFKLADKETKSGKQAKSEYYSHIDIVKDILAGKRMDSCKMAIRPTAYLINGSHSLPLSTALEQVGKKNGFPDEKNRSVASAQMFKAENSSDMLVVIVKTESKPGSSPHFHTVVWSKDQGGDWKIAHWHASQ
jgi:TonB family protein